MRAFQLPLDPSSALGSDSRAPKFDLLLPLLLVGYLFWGRAFAWLHIPGTPLFVGEIVLAFGLAGAVKALTWYPIWRHSSVPLIMAIYVAWGLARFIPGFFGDPVVALRDSAVWIYVIIAWAVLSVLALRPHNLGRWLKGYLTLMPYVAVWMPLSVVLGSLDLGTVPDSNVRLTSFDTGLGQVHLLMMVTFLWLVWNPLSPRLLRWRLVVTGIGMVGLLAMGARNRGGLVAAMIGIALLLVLHPSRSRLVINGARVMVVVIALFLVLDPKIDVGEREISAAQLSSNLTSLVTLEGEGGVGGNISWRLSHWGNIVEGVNRNVPLTGHGFGPNIAEIYFIPQTDIGLRNAHNSHLTIIARAGWIGFALWLGLWATWYYEVNRARRRLRGAGFDRLSGLAGWAMVAVTGFHVEATFNPSIEGPPASFWLWSICALGLFLLVLSQPRRAAALLRTPGRATPTHLDVDRLENDLERLLPGRANPTGSR